MAKKRGTALQMSVIDLWVNGKSRQEIANELNCSLFTVDQTKGDPELKQLYYQKCSEQIEQLVPFAIKRLDKIIKDDTVQSSVHVAAVREILDRSHIKELTEKLNTQIDITVKYE